MYADESRMVSVVIAAAGKGTRMGMEINKQYLEVLGMPVLARTIQSFEACSLIDEIIVVANEAELGYCNNIIEPFGFRKIRAVTAGGATRQQSVLKGLCKVSADSGIVLIHDGARPFIDEKDIVECIDAAGRYGAAIMAVPAKDTIKSEDKCGFVDETLDRSSLWYIQTPQAFDFKLIMEAHRRAAEDGFEGTDDAVLIERTGHRVRLVMGNYLNIKITTKEDIILAEAICRHMHAGLKQ